MKIQKKTVLISFVLLATAFSSTSKDISQKTTKEAHTTCIYYHIDTVQEATKTRILVQKSKASTTYKMTKLTNTDEDSTHITSIEDIRTSTPFNPSKKTNFIISPNPINNGRFSINTITTVPKRSFITTTHYIIYGINGTTLQQGIMSSLPIDISKLQQGGYFLQIVTDQKQYTKMIIKY